MENNHFFERNKAVILQVLQNHDPIDKGNYAKLNCSQCGKPNAYVYYSAGKFAKIRCSHKNHCGYIVPVPWPEQAAASRNERSQEIEEYFKEHSLDLAGLIESGMLDEQTRLHLGNHDGREYYKYLHKIQGKLRWCPTKGWKAEMGAFYPVIETGQEILNVYEGESDWMKGLQDGFACTSSLFGAKYVPKTENDFALFMPYSQIRLVYDSDMEGERGAGRVGLALAEKYPTKKIELIKLPFTNGDGKDYCDFRKLHTLEEFLAIPAIPLEAKKTAKQKKAEKTKEEFEKKQKKAKGTGQPFIEVIRRIEAGHSKSYIVAQEGIFEETINTNESFQMSYTTYEKVCDDPVIVKDRVEIIEEEESAYVTLLVGDIEKIVPMDYLLAKNADKLCKRGIRVIRNTAAKAMSEYFELALFNTQVRTVYKTLGWHERKFVIAGLAENREIIRDTLKLGYRVENGNLKLALEAIKSLAKVVKDGFLALLTYVLLPPATPFLKLEPFKFVLAVLGQTGNFKTTLCKKVMGIYGEEFLSNKYLRFAEGATDNAIIKTCALARHLPVLVDNYKPNIAGGETRLIQIITMIVEGKDKQRLDQKGDFRDAPELEAWAIFTGEAWIENDTSAIARCLTIEFHKNEDALECLQFAQEREEHLPALGYAWLNWLSSEEGEKACKEVRVHWKETCKEWNKKAYQANVQNADRVAANFASLVQGFDLACKCPFFAWLEEQKVSFMAYLQKAIENMAYTTKEAREGVRFLQAISELLASGRVLLCEGKNSQPDKESIKTYLGWDCKEEKVIYFLTSVVLREVQKLVDIHITKNALFRQLEEENAIAEKSEKTTITKWLGSEKRRVLAIKREKIISE